jgi:hypothetical protein
VYLQHPGSPTLLTNRSSLQTHLFSLSGKVLNLPESAHNCQTPQRSNLLTVDFQRSRSPTLPSNHNPLLPFIRTNNHYLQQKHSLNALITY